MSSSIPPTLLLDPAVISDPYPFYQRLRTEAPVWHVPDTVLFVVSTFAAIAEATSRVEDFSNNIGVLLYRDDAGLPQRLPFGGDMVPQTLATADPPAHTVHRATVFPELGQADVDAQARDRRLGEPVRQALSRRAQSTSWSSLATSCRSP
jgi:cytochrome P450